MNDDLGEILLSIQKTQSNILSRLSALEKLQQVSGTNELTVPGGWGYASPTSPPSTFLRVRGGICWTFDSNYEDTGAKGWPDFSQDLFVSSFSDAYYYRGIVAFLNLFTFDPKQGFDIWEADTDFETYEECAQYMSEDFYFVNIYPDISGNPVFPICALAIRNNGTTGSTRQYLPITLNDREQSSFIYRDVRPWFYAGLWF